jgi:hypothetical protein
LTNGEGHALYLKLEDWEEEAVVLVRVNLHEQASAIECSGVLIASAYVLTARHCVSFDEDIESLTVVFGDDSAAPAATVPGTVAAVHPELDLALVELESAVTSAGTIPVASELPTSVRTGSLLQVAGVGVDASGDASVSTTRRAFLAEQVQSVGAKEITIANPQGTSGACAGDSGGPALVRGNDGQVWVIGVLEGGARSCTGADEYTRVDIAAKWLTERVGTLARRTPSGAIHSALGGRGRCFGGVAVWSGAGALHAATCDGVETCGWDAAAAGFRCVRPGSDACSGVSELGSCYGHSAVRCIEGTLSSVPCASCGWVCGLSPKSGEATCF